MNTPDSSFGLETTVDQAISEKIKRNPEGVVFFDPPIHADQELEYSIISDSGKHMDLPRGQLSMASYLRENKVSASVVPMDAYLYPRRGDFIIDGKSDNENFRLALNNLIDEKVEKSNPKVMAFGLMYTFVEPTVLKMTRYAKEKYPDRYVIVGGNHATFSDLDLLDPENETGIDIVVKYEGEETMCELMAELSKESPDLSQILGISYRDNNGGVVQNEARNKADLYALPPLDYGLVETPEGVGMDKFNHTAMFVRGCHGNCAFCTSPRFWDKKVREGKKDNFQAEIEYLAKNGVKSVGLLDDDILASNEGFDLIVGALKEVKQKYPELVFIAQTRVDHLRNKKTECQAWLSEMKEAGISRLYLGIESGSPEILREMRKGYRVEWVEEALKNVKKAGIETGGFWLIGHPGATQEWEGKSVDFMEHLLKDGLLDDVEAHGVVPLPGTKIANDPRIRVIDHDKKHYGFMNNFPVYELIDPETQEVILSREQIYSFLYRTLLLRKKYLGIEIEADHVPITEVVPTEKREDIPLAQIRGEAVPAAEGEKKVNYIQTPSLFDLLKFEKESWPEEEQASAEDLMKRLKNFPEGIFMLLADGEPQAQITISPKNITDPDTIDSFERMRDMGVDRKSPVLWITNMASSMNSKGKGYVSELLSEVIRWAEVNGYQSIMAGVTCDNYADLLDRGEVSSIGEYMEQGKNPGVRTFRSAARKYENKTKEKPFVWSSDAIADYWPVNAASGGYGAMAAIDLPNKNYNQDNIVPPIEILERTSRAHLIERIKYDSGVAGPELADRVAAAYDIWHQHRHDSFSDLRTVLNQLWKDYDDGWDKMQQYPSDLSWKMEEELQKATVKKLYCTVIIRLLMEYKARIHESKNESENPPAVEYTIDLDHVNNLGVENRETVTGSEKTAFILLPPRGCKMKCDFCSPSHIANPNYPLTAIAAEQAAEETAEAIRKAGAVNTVKLFNAGNILWGSEFGQSAGALHERYWEILPQLLAENDDVMAVEIEVRLDEFSSNLNDELTGTDPKREIVRNRLLKLKNDLASVKKELRVILAIEYSSDVLANESGIVNKGTENSRNAISFLREHGIPWIGYAMLGGRLKDRTISPQEAVRSACRTANFGFEHHAREMVVNCQYLDPINRFEEERDGVPFCVPAKRDILSLLQTLAYGLTEGHRLRISLDKEDSIRGTMSAADYDPAIDEEFKTFIREFNNAKDQQGFYFSSKYRRAEAARFENSGMD